MTKYILAFDRGTTSSRAIIFNRNGNMLTVAQKEFQQIFPQPGWVEHDADEIWSSQIGVANEALARVGSRASDIAEEEIVQQWQVEKRFEPSISVDQREALRDSWRLAIAQTRNR